MCDLYNKIENLCKKHNTNITALCSELSISRGSLGDLKAGRSQSLSTKTLIKIAQFFKAPLNYFFDDNSNAFIDNDIRRIQRAREKMPEKEKQKMMKMITTYFDEYFSDDDIDDDIDE